MEVSLAFYASLWGRVPTKPGESAGKLIMNTERDS